MSKLTKKPKGPVLSRLTQTLVAGTVAISGCGDAIGVPAMDAGPADAGPPTDAAGPDVGFDAPAPGVPAADAGPDTEAPDPGLPPFDAGPDAEAPAPGLPAPDAGPDAFVGI
ncbi:MAG: hypothetical protein AB8H86_09130 [Polyangiales bacterium]